MKRLVLLWPGKDRKEREQRHRERETELDIEKARQGESVRGMYVRMSACIYVCMFLCKKHGRFLRVRAGKPRLTQPSTGRNP